MVIHIHKACVYLSHKYYEIMLSCLELAKTEKELLIAINICYADK